MNGRLLILFVIVMLQALFLPPMLHAVTAGSFDPLPEQKTSSVPQWENLKGIDIIPCPKKITVYDTAISIDDNLAILIGKSSSERTRTAALDLQDIIREKTSINVPVIVDGENIGKKHLIILGTPSELPEIQRYCESARISLNELEPQGYAIFPSTDADKQDIILAGKDKTIQLAKIVDWPDFKHRVCETLTEPMKLLFMAKSEKQKKVAWESVKKGIREAARLKFNYNRCFAILYSRPLTDYPLDIRAQMMGEAGEYANKRGMKLYLNLTTAVATNGDEGQFPQLKECLRFLHLYVSWSDDQLIDHACDKITQMSKIIGPQQYFFHSPDVPYMGWNRRSENDRKRWGDDRVLAEEYLVNKIFNALKKGAPGAGFSYVSSPYCIDCVNNSPEKIAQLEIVERLSPKLPENLSLLWREGSLESARKFRQLTKNSPQEYYIENSSFHKNRLLGGTARTAKTYYFKNSDNDFFYDNSNTSTHPAHKPQNGILAEYAWNTQAPGSVFIHQNDQEKEKMKGMTVNGMPWGEWMTVYDLDGPLREELIPRTCRQFFGEKVGNTLALAYSVGSSINDNALGGMVIIPYDKRYENSIVFAERLVHASSEMAKLWDKADLFNSETYPIYRMAFKYVYIYQYIEKINSYLMRLSWIAETGKDEDKVDVLTDEALAYIKKARKEIADGYKKYNLQSIHYAAIYDAKIGNLADVYKKIDNIESAINFKNKQIKMFGGGNLPKKEKTTAIGITPLPAAFNLDGKLDEWDIASANILDKSFYNRKMGDQGIAGSKDVIAYWNAAWDESYLYIAVLVFDDKLSFSEYSPLYKNDAVELWINKQQFIFSITPDGKTSTEPYGNYDKNKVKIAAQRGEKAHQLHPDMKYWSLEIKIPFDCLETSSKIGNSFYMALGVDDIDPGEEPSQIFFPDTYQHLSMTQGASCSKNFARVVLQPKTELTATLISSQIKDVAKSDGTYTCVDLELALNCKEKTIGISSELFLYAKDGIRRFNVDIPDTLEGDWKKTIQIVTNNLYDSDTGIDLIVRAPGYYKKIELRGGKYRDLGLGFTVESGQNIVESASSCEKPGYDSLWTADFDDDSCALHAKDGVIINPASKKDYTVVDGIKLNAARILDGGELRYKLSKAPLVNKGKIELWLKPEYGAADKNTRTFIELISPGGNIRFSKNGPYSYMFVISVNGKIHALSVKPVEIRTGSWNYVALQWNSEEKSMMLNVNGVTKMGNNVEFSFKSPFQLLIVGNEQNGNQGSKSIIDELKIQNLELPSNSQIFMGWL